MSWNKLDFLQGTPAVMLPRTLDAMRPLPGHGIARRIEQVSENPAPLNQGTIYASIVRLPQRGCTRGEGGIFSVNRRARFDSIARRGSRQLAADVLDGRRPADVIDRMLARAPEGS